MACPRSHNSLGGGAPLPFPVLSLVRAFLLEKAPYELWPYEILRGADRDEFPHPDGRIIGERQWHTALQSTRLRRRLEISGFAGRLLSAVEILESSLRVGRMSNRPRDNHQDRVLEVLADMQLWMEPPVGDFRFYVAGGFCVSMILGHGTWDDIDVFFEPREMSDGRWVVVSGHGCYPVNVLTVTNVMAQIATSDLDICKCAIECRIVGHQRQYRFLLTRACAAAWMNTCVLWRRMVPCLSEPTQIGVRLQKYRRRTLDAGISLLGWYFPRTMNRCWRAVREGPG